jgi:hypothetical protein
VTAVLLYYVGHPPLRKAVLTRVKNILQMSASKVCQSARKNHAPQKADKKMMNVKTPIEISIISQDVAESPLSFKQL